ncbi:YMGG-like glycine zipper-containing protein [Litoreibacter roseus]|uniref:YMGG-like Gly-zipper domain-containing protein n=1 Tax=Litoreibacter roseus TaxID=2601869 RepID=A0A6N6JCM5_9RHOB|nr:YMGG-like glycine zipper-containing protein [Litoreibacter roseus]GFE64083.1 hypothetical protein KIN_11570 [Litoreibacter roseus]
MQKLIFSAFAVLIMLLSACTEESLQLASVTGGGNKTPAEKALEKEVKSLNQQTRDIIVRNTVQGALAGAAAGCLVGALIGDSGDCARGAAAGAVIGGIGGNQVGRKAANVNKELVKQREIIANLNGVNKRLTSVEGNLKRVVASQNAEIRSLRRQRANNQLSSSDYAKRVNAINDNRKAVRNGLGTAEQNVAKSRTELVKLEKEGGRPLTSSKKAASSTQRRLSSLRKSVALVSG